MAITKSVYARNAQCNAIVDLVDLGSGSPSGHLKIFTADATTLVSLNLSNPAFSSAVDGTALANYISDATNLATGDATTFKFFDRDSTFIWGGIVTPIGLGGDMQLNSIHMVADQTTSISPAYYVVP